MKNRRNIFKKLEKSVPNNLLLLVKELFEEIKRYIQNMSMYYEDSIYIELFVLLYESPQKKYTNLELSYELHIDIKVIKNFVNKMETFVPNYIMFYPHFHTLKEYTHN